MVLESLLEKTVPAESPDVGLNGTLTALEATAAPGLTVEIDLDDRPVR